VIEDSSVIGTDLLAPYGRNERCWCGSDRKYKEGYSELH